MLSKTYKIIREVSSVDGQITYLALARDGDCWKVKRVVNLYWAAWSLGETVVVPLGPKTQPIGELTPQWHVLDVVVKAFPTRHPAIYSELLDWWGPETAARHGQPGNIQLRPRTLTVTVQEHMFADGDDKSTAEKAQMASVVANFIANDMRSAHFNQEVAAAVASLYDMPQVHSHDQYAAWFAAAPARWHFVKRISESIPTDPFIDVKRFVRNYCVLFVLGRWTKTYAHAASTAARAQLVRLLTRYGVPEGYQLPKEPR